MGASPAHAFMKAVAGQGPIPEWISAPGSHALIHKGCKQNAHRSPILYVFTDEALGQSLKTGKGEGLASISLSMRPIRKGRHPRIGLISGLAPMISCYLPSRRRSSPMYDLRRSCAAFLFGLRAE